MSYAPIPNASKTNFSELVAKQRSSAEMAAPVNKELEALGIQGKTTIIPMKDEDGNPMFDKQGKQMYRQVFEASHIPDWYQRAISVFEGRQPCWFEGCQKIVDAYNDELAAAKKSGGCSACKKGGIQRKYLREIQAALPASELHRVAQPTSPPMVVKNHDTKEVKKIERKPVPYATIKRIIPDELKSLFTKTPEERKLFVDANATTNNPTRPAQVSGSASESAD